MRKLEIDGDITRAETLPADVYHEPRWYERAKERIFARSWQCIGNIAEPKTPGDVRPFTLLEGCLDEPLVLTVDDSGQLHCLSNVCTHRGALVVEGEGHVKALRCRYHGRRFALDGKFCSMPEFDGVANFPTERDDLPRVGLARWGPLLFCNLDPAFSFDELVRPMQKRVSFLPLDEARYDAASSRDYLINANWRSTAITTSRNFTSRSFTAAAWRNSITASIVLSWILIRRCRLASPSRRRTPLRSRKTIPTTAPTSQRSTTGCSQT